MENLLPATWGVITCSVGTRGSLQEASVHVFRRWLLEFMTQNWHRPTYIRHLTPPALPFPSSLSPSSPAPCPHAPGSPFPCTPVPPFPCTPDPRHLHRHLSAPFLTCPLIPCTLTLHTCLPPLNYALVCCTHLPPTVPTVPCPLVSPRCCPHSNGPSLTPPPPSLPCPHPLHKCHPPLQLLLITRPHHTCLPALLPPLQRPRGTPRQRQLSARGYGRTALQQLKLLRQVAYLQRGDPGQAVRAVNSMEVCLLVTPSAHVL